jgi:hypothetical protein
MPLSIGNTGRVGFPGHRNITGELHHRLVLLGAGLPFSFNMMALGLRHRPTPSP